MPTYVVTIPEDRLSFDQKQKLAMKITNIHCATTGAPAYFAQVIFNEVALENYFLAGKPLKQDNIFIHGQIRAGRDVKTKEKLILEIMSSAAAIAETDKSHIQVYIVDVPADQIARVEKASDPAEAAYQQTLEFAQHALAQPAVRGLHITDFRHDETLERLMTDLGRKRS